MSDADVILDYKQANAALCRRSFYYFLKEFWSIIIPEDPVWNWHIKYLCDEMQTIVERLRDRLPKVEDVLINIPPGTTKSTIISVMLPAWAWTIDPSMRILTVTHADTLSMKFSVKSREIIECDKYRDYFPYVELKKYQNSKSDYENTKNGQRFSAGLEASITGQHFHLIIIDDPLNPKESVSEKECITASNLIDSTLSTRKVDKSLTVTMMLMQRLSDNDPSGGWLSKKDKRIRHICLPAEEKDGPVPAHLSKYYVNGLLDPIRLSPQVLHDAKIDLGAAGYAGQFAQRPVPAGGLIWQKWFVEVPDHLFPSKKFMTQYGTDWDTAYTKDDDNAASAYVSAGKIGHKIYIDDFGWDWLEFPKLITWMKTKPSPHYIEAKASGKSSKQTLVDNGVIAIEVPVKGGSDKIARANMATPVAECGIVHIRKSMADLIYNDSKQGILNFPRGKFKDLADVLAQALQRLGKKSVMNSTPAGNGHESGEHRD